ncbi:MAG TPA: hypothetical protein VKU00_32755 [Chthonomonadaceae bacterium]|nr:hypothetical protein [Chthonomonadaceae bacterium]
MLFRHGDIIIEAVKEIPTQAKRQVSTILAHGELTGHNHRIEDPETAEIFVLGGECFLRVRALTARVIHEEHKPITLPQGLYRFWYQREYTPQAIRRVYD